MPQHDIDIKRDPVEKELDVSLALADQVAKLKQRVTHLETLEAAGGDFVALDKIELTADAASITFASIPQIYIALQIVTFMRTNLAATSDDMEVTFNNDTGNNYDWVSSNIRVGGLTIGQGIAVAFIAVAGVGDSAPANVFASDTLRIPDYTGANHKNVEIAGARKLANSSTNIFISGGSGFWRDTSPITEIDFTPLGGTNFLAGSKFYLYGIRAS